MQIRSTFTVPRLHAIVLAIALASALSIALAPAATAQTSLSQCNGTDNVGGQAVECHYTITNNVNGSVTSSRTTVMECHGAANDPATLVCTPSTTDSTQLVTVVDQCNGSGNGGGGTVLCTVDIINNITADAIAGTASVNQCNASGTGGGTEPTVLCDPFPATTTGADVTQCNESGNGGGGTQRVQCSVDSDSTAPSILDITVTQCNGSGNGGGATVTCRTGMTTNITAPAPGPSASPSSDGGSGTSGSGSGGSASGGGSDTGTGTGGGLDTGQVTRVPAGGVGAGGGSTSGIEYLWALMLGVVLIASSSTGIVLHRRATARVR